MSLNSTNEIDYNAASLSEGDIYSLESIPQLAEVYMTLQAAKDNLWKPGHHDSYYRDRYDRNDNYRTLMKAVKNRIIDLMLKDDIY